jgi:hypothetical protein
MKITIHSRCWQAKLAGDAEAMQRDRDVTALRELRLPRRFAGTFDKPFWRNAQPSRGFFSFSKYSDVDRGVLSDYGMQLEIMGTMFAAALADLARREMDDF